MNSGKKLVSSLLPDVEVTRVQTNDAYSTMDDRVKDLGTCLHQKVYGFTRV